MCEGNHEVKTQYIQIGYTSSIETQFTTVISFYLRDGKNKKPEDVLPSMFFLFFSLNNKN